MPEETATTYGTQRKAAERNRAAILEVAHELFAQNPATSMNEVAKRAGVGAGTLYRHFPTREALILAVYRHDVEKLVAAVDGLLAQHSAKDAFVEWFETLAAYIRVKHGLGEALHNAAIQDAINETYAPVTAAVGKLLDACSAEGTVRPGLDPGDVLLLMGFLWRVAPDDDGVTQGRRLTAMVFDGIGVHGVAR
ncbi:TetR/AcrR family transcriptional regulator [Myceligenerans pegani]|uniref:TetR/AcrR family transcriptional regulator n=1 Tax=Myceligenerans pegani TaxID=2776917 RepID=A0ABR9MVL5_9MICO|nr:TetR/AcrR family transcriptional regulator [Myceligenerans sp. TRM 65318]MBE1875429.1 TetR/AcrR family transcriptional regulator [Myceligenerans sp. TRM 65318]MBE3017700.1 TetR/AcrR family transcriptional regulator [Myceligenerans sp. TRM 65318]